jgi:archaellum biogenesis protein FlaJ (TadC family)
MKELVNLNYIENGESRKVIIKKEDRFKFMSKSSDIEMGRKNLEIKKPFLVGFIEFSNRFFKNIAAKLSKQNFSIKLKEDLIKITAALRITNYLSMALMCIMLSFFGSLLIAGILAAFGIINLLIAIIIVIFIPLLTLLIFYLYPSSERSNLEKSINQELPFLTIYMAAIATSGIEPSKIFTILAATNDYPHTQREIKKIINYVNFYGYDLSSALKMVARNNPSEELSQLFEGLSTTITSGGALSNFLEKHSETLLFDYRLEREKYTRTAETFLDIYISIVIAAPMILMILFVLIGITGMGGSSLTAGILSMIVILAISIINIFFLFFLNLKQPKF